MFNWLDIKFSSPAREARQRGCGQAFLAHVLKMTLDRFLFSFQTGTGGFT